MRKAPAIAAATALLLFGACGWFTGPDGRFMGVIGYDDAWDGEANADGPSRLTLGGAFNRVAADTTLPWCPDHPHSFDERCATLSAPDTVSAGVPFQATVRTTGQAGCEVPDGAEVSESDSMLEVVPYDRRAGYICADAMGNLPRTVELVFPDPGDALLRVTGRILIVRDSVVDERVGSLDHPIVVR